MKPKPFYKCEHCVYYTSYYNICDDVIVKVHCGYCNLKTKMVKLSLRDCAEFELFASTQKEDKAREVVQTRYDDVFKKLRKIEKQLKCLKVYLNKDDTNLKIDKEMFE